MCRVCREFNNHLKISKMKTTKKEINAEIKTSKDGRTFNHCYYSEDNRYDFQTRLFESASNQNRVTDGGGFCVSGILENKKEFIDWLYNKLN